MSDVERFEHRGPSVREITLAESRLGQVWNVRGNPAQRSFVSEAERALGLPLPLQSNTSARADDSALLWLGPTSWLLIAGPGSLRDDFDMARRALNAAGGALFDVSASYVAWRVSGAAAGRVLNRSCPLDLHPRAFPTGRCAQSMLGHINALFYKPWERSEFIVMVARSFSADAWRDLCASAASEGYRLPPAAPM